MKRIAAPLIGGIVTSFVLELLVYPALYEVWKWRFELKHAAGEPSEVAIRSELGSGDSTMAGSDLAKFGYKTSNCFSKLDR